MEKRSSAKPKGRWDGMLVAPAKPNGKKRVPNKSTLAVAQKSPYRRYLDSQGIFDKKTNSVKFPRTTKEEMQRIFLDALRDERPLPKEMKFVLACAFEELCAGISPGILTPKRGQGKRRPPVEKYLQMDAIRYLRWCEDGHIADESPIITVATAYKVSEKTVRAWRKTWAEKPVNAIAQDIFGADSVAMFMRTSGLQYRRLV